MHHFESSSLMMRLVALAACAALCVAGCASGGKTLGEDPETWANSISISDHLIVVTHSGHEKEVHVTAVDESGISGDNEFIPYSDIKSIRVLPSKAGASRSTELIVILTIVVAALVFTLLESEIEEGFIQGAQ